jgi:hypothetical protein
MKQIRIILLVFIPLTALIFFSVQQDAASTAPTGRCHETKLVTHGGCRLVEPRLAGAGRTMDQHHLLEKTSVLTRFDAVWRIVSGVVYQFGGAVTIHAPGGMGVQPGRVNGVAHIDASLC